MYIILVQYLHIHCVNWEHHSNSKTGEEETAVWWKGELPFYGG